jgi:prophage antirepressor-like protein
MSALQTFDFETNAVRVLMRDEVPWFVAADVCRALGLTNSRMVIEKLDEDEKGVSLTDTLGGAQRVQVINESGLYTVILRSRDAMTAGTVAHRFRKWVTGEVLPSIRRTGRYEAPAFTDSEDGLPNSGDLRLWGVPLNALIAATRVVTTIKAIYGPEFARRAWESETSLPQVRALAQTGSIDDWMNTETDRDPSSVVQASELFNHYVAWCQSRGKPPESLRRFGDRVTACFEKRERAGRMFYYGIRPRAIPAKEAPPA